MNISGMLPDNHKETAMKTSSRTEYLRRIDRVVTRLSSAIANEEALPSVTDLARSANLSEFHFMRVYRALAGEPLAPPSSG